MYSIRSLINPLFLDFLIKALRPCMKLISCQIFVAIIWAIDFSLRPYLIKSIIDIIPSVIASGSVDIITMQIYYYFCLIISVFFVFRLYEWVILTLHPRMIKNIGEMIMLKLMDKSYTFFQNQFSGSLANKVGDVTNGISTILNMLIDSLLANIIALTLATYTVYTVSPNLSLVLVIWTIVFLILSLKFSGRASVLSKNTAEKRSDILGLIVDILTNIFSVRVFANKGYEKNNLSKAYQKFTRSYKTRDWFFMKIHALQEVSFIVYQALCIVWLIQCIKQGTVTSGDFAMIMMINMSVVNSLYSLSHNIHSFSESFGNVMQGLETIYDNTNDHTIYNFHNKHHQISQSQILSPKYKENDKGEVRFKNLSFSYPNSHQIFKNMSVVIPACQKVGIIGYSGGGKTTFMNLILGLFEASSGQILLDGIDIKTISRKALYSKIGLIPQDIALFNRTLMENIRYGCIEATDEEVINAAKKAKAHSFISKLPKGYHSSVGERGIKLSGGERQRIAIARAILKKAPILLLDEVTNQLDSITEHEIQESLEILMKDKTSIIIAHKLSTILHLDRILVFDNGNIVQDGCHQELIKQEGLYKKLWQNQCNGLLPLNNEEEIT